MEYVYYEEDKNDLIKIEKAIKELTSLYKISLALFDYKKVMIQKKQYEKLVNNFFLELALNIENEKYFDKLKEYIELWEFAIDKELKIILLAIMYKKSEQISYWYEIATTFLIPDKTRYVIRHSFESDKYDEFKSKSLAKLLKLFMKSTRKVGRQDLLYNLAVNTNSINIAKKAIFFLNENDKDIIKDIENHINNLVFLKRLDNNCEDLALMNDKLDDDQKIFLTKKLYKINPEKAKELVSKIDNKKSDYKFRAYIAVQNKDKKAITKLIDDLNKMYQDVLFSDDYDSIICSIFDEIYEEYPLMAHELIDKYIKENKEEILPELYPYLFDIDIEKAMEYFLKIEDYPFKIEILQKVVERYEDLKIFERILENLDIVFPIDSNPWHLGILFSQINDRYRAVFLLNKKISIPKEILYDLVARIEPYMIIWGIFDFPYLFNCEDEVSIDNFLKKLIQEDKNDLYL